MHKQVMDFAYGFFQGEIRLSARKLLFPFEYFCLNKFYLLGY